ncbi:MAG: sugar ABC transporter ATP-binding protein [Armatimonadetes bacterium 55-13]|nr:carbohydrate ABC transporter permease [Armatimonadota bacterium]OJU65491.1 MAG: sugar ABC transporter ATP-binding protein [Armatimonadetes bacterium 55-13]
MTTDGPKLNLGSKVATYVVLTLLCLPALLPLVWMISTSLKGDTQIYNATDHGLSLSTLVPSPLHPENYPDALNTLPFLVYLRNTLFLCICTVLGAVVSSAVVAYGFAKVNFTGKNTLFMLMIATMALPGQVTMIPVFSLYRSLGWYGTYLPIIVPAFTASAYYVFLMTQFFRTIPNEMSEAARVDGAGEWTIFTRLILPLSKPALATCALFQFIGTWNDFLGPLLYINDPAKYPLAYGLQQFVTLYGGKHAQLMAASTIFTIPIIILFFFAQKTFIQGISTTGGK